MKNEEAHPHKGETIRRLRGRPRTVSDDSKRLMIIEEAHRTFRELGYGGTTMDLVATHCKISKQTLYKLFSGKTELFMAVIGLHRASMVALPRDEDENLPLGEALEEIFMLHMDEEADRDRQAFIHFIVREAEHFPEIALLLHEHGVQGSRRLLSEWLQRENDRGRITIADAASGARMLLSVVMGAIAPLPGNLDSWPSSQERNVHLRRCFDVFLSGVLPRQQDTAGR